MPKKILVVEDEDEYRELAARLLAEAGYAVAAAPTGKRGLELYAAEAPDLVLLDVMLPDMLGFEFCKKVRAGAGRSKTPILFCSVRSAVSSLLQAVRSGGDDYVLKPFVPEDLLARVKAALSKGS